MEKVREVKYIIEYNGKNITDDISRFITSILYVDNVSGFSDELEITMDNIDGLWIDKWYPEKGDKISFRFGYDISNLTNSGVFEVDEIEADGPPDKIIIKAIATGITKGLRTFKSKAFENVTLKQIAKEIARQNGLQLVDSTPTSSVYSYPTADIVEMLNKLKKEFKSIVESNLGRYVDEIINQTGSNQTDAPAYETMRIGQRYKWIYPYWKDVTIPGIETAAGMYDSKNLGENPVRKFLYRMFPSAAPIGTYVAPFFKTSPNGIPMNSITPDYNGTANDCPLIMVFFPELDDLITRVKNNGGKVQVGSVSQLDSLMVERSTQYRETDLAYLKRLADKYNFAFSVKGDKLIFISKYKLHAEKPVTTIDKSQLSKYRFLDRTEKISTAAQPTYYANDEEHLQATMGVKKAPISPFGATFEQHKNADGVDFNTVGSADFAEKSGDIHKNFSRVENQEQSVAVAQSDMYKMIVRQRTGTFTMEGDSGLVAGVNINVTGLGKFDGKYSIDKSTHRISKSVGYQTTLDIVRAGSVANSTKRKIAQQLKNKPTFLIGNSNVSEFESPVLKNKDEVTYRVVK